MSITASVARQFWFLSHTMARCTVESQRLLRYSKFSAETKPTTHKKKKKKKVGYRESNLEGSNEEDYGIA